MRQLGHLKPLKCTGPKSRHKVGVAWSETRIPGEPAIKSWKNQLPTFRGLKDEVNSIPNNRALDSSATKELCSAVNQGKESVDTGGPVLFGEVWYPPPSEQLHQRSSAPTKRLFASVRKTRTST